MVLVVLLVCRSGLKVVLRRAKSRKKRHKSCFIQKKSLDVKCTISRGKTLSIANSGKVNHFRLLSYANFMSFHPDTLKMGKSVSTDKLY